MSHTLLQGLYFLTAVLAGGTSILCALAAYYHWCHASQLRALVKQAVRTNRYTWEVIRNYAPPAAPRQLTSR